MMAANIIAAFQAVGADIKSLYTSVAARYTATQVDNLLGTKADVNHNQAATTINVAAISGITATNAQTVLAELAARPSGGGNATTVPSKSVTTTPYTAQLADAGLRLHVNRTSASVVTIPNNTTVAFPVETVLYVTQGGTGATTVAGASGVTLRAADGLKVGNQWRTISLIKIATNEWVVQGGMA